MVKNVVYLLFVLLTLSGIYGRIENKLNRAMRENARYKGDNPNINKYDIDRCLELSVGTDKDTVSFGDDLVLTVTFRNRTDSVQYFYPMFVLNLIRFSGNTFGLDCIYRDESMDLSHYQKIDPRGEYSVKYTVRVTRDSFFEVENPYLQVTYSCARIAMSSKYNDMYGNGLYGNMRTSKFNIYVKE